MSLIYLCVCAFGEGPPTDVEMKMKLVYDVLDLLYIEPGGSYAIFSWARMLNKMNELT